MQDTAIPAESSSRQVCTQAAPGKKRTLTEVRGHLAPTPLLLPQPQGQVFFGKKQRAGCREWEEAQAGSLASEVS